MINKVTLIGNLGADPELRTIESGATVASFGLATNENYKDKNGEWQTQTEWHNIVLWRESADRAASQLKKGMMVFVEGKISYRKFTDKDGVERKTTDIVASSFRMLEKREGGGTTNRPPSTPSEEPDVMTTSSRSSNGTSMPQPPPPTVEGGDDLPF
jgi:single-strand DNA-binding protein